MNVPSCTRATWPDACRTPRPSGVPNWNRVESPNRARNPLALPVVAANPLSRTAIRDSKEIRDGRNLSVSLGRCVAWITVGLGIAALGWSAFAAWEFYDAVERLTAFARPAAA